MSYKYLNNYNNFISIRMKDSLTKCTVGLEHSVSGDYYWLSATVKFYIGEESDLLVFLGGGNKRDANLIFSTIEAFGFKLDKRRFMREWEYYDYQRVPVSNQLSNLAQNRDEPEE